MRTELSIRGMSCASCAAHVTSALLEVEGVRDARVNLATERAVVEHEPQTAADAFIQAVERAGYEADDRLDDAADEAARAAELRRRLRMVWIAGVFGVPAVALAMSGYEFPGKTVVVGALAIVVWAVVGYDFHRGAIAALRNRTATMDTLVSLGSTAAIVLSVVQAFRGAPTYFESATAIVALVALGKYLESAARARSNGALRTLLELRPTSVQRVEGDAVNQRALSEIAVGDTLVVAPHERIPTDGVVELGEGYIDRASLTGESTPVDVQPGAQIEAGTLNGDTMLRVRATGVGEQTEIARIIAAVRRAQGTAPPIARLADRVAAVFVPTIVGIAIATLLGWLFAHAGVDRAMIAAVAVLVVACPCALGLATPVAVVAGIGLGARHGVLFKDAPALERASNIDIIAFDKTGTLTTGRLSVQHVTDERALAYAAALERNVTHPIAHAIVAAAQARGLTLAPAHDVRVERGFGVAGSIDGTTVRVGNAAFVGMASSEDADTTCAYVTSNGDAIGTIALADTPRDNAAATIAQLRAQNIESALVSGDGTQIAARIAASLGIERVFAERSPTQKAEVVESLRADQRRVAFVGDGINDTPALVDATLGIAMGAGSTAALDVADVALLRDDIASVIDVVTIGRATMRTIHQNLFWAFAYNVVLIPLAAFGIVTPMLAAAAMGLSSLFVVINALRLGSRRLPSAPRAPNDR